MALINLGRILPIWQGSWNSTTTYENLDIVYYGGSSYVAVGGSGNTGKYPDEEGGTYWKMLARGGSFEGMTEDQIIEIARQLNTVTYVVGSNTYND